MHANQDFHQLSSHLQICFTLILQETAQVRILSVLKIWCTLTKFKDSIEFSWTDPILSFKVHEQINKTTFHSAILSCNSALGKRL